MRPLKQMEKEAWRDYKAAHSAWKLRQKQQPQQEEDPEPQPDTMIVTDTTVEILARLMERNPRGMMLHRDELSGWYLSLNQYRAQGGSDRQFYLQCWSGGSYRVDRVTKPPLFVPDVYLSLYGTLQPEVARKVFKDGDIDGFTARFGLLVFPDMPETVAVVDQRPNYEARNAVERRLRALRAAHRVKEEPLRFDGAAYVVFNRWYLANTNHPERNAGAFGTHLGKYPGLFARLALVLHFIKHGPGGAEKDVRQQTAIAVKRIEGSTVRGGRSTEEYVVNPAVYEVPRPVLRLVGNRFRRFCLFAPVLNRRRNVSDYNILGGFAGYAGVFRKNRGVPAGVGPVRLKIGVNYKYPLFITRATPPGLTPLFYKKHRRNRRNRLSNWKR